MEEQDKDPFAEFGGSVVTAKEDPFKEFGGVVVPKKPTPSGGPNTLKQLGNGFDISQPFQAPTELIPVLPDHRAQVRQEQANRATQLSNQLKNNLKALNPEARAQVEKIIPTVTNNGELKEVSQEDQDHYDFMQTPGGKLLGGVAYLGSKATKGSLQVLKGAAYLADMAASPISAITGVNNPTIDKAFEKADEKANFGLTKGDQSRMEESSAMRNLGGFAEFLPSVAAGSETGGATFYLQGMGQGKETMDAAEKNGAKINPLVKNAFILGTGAVNGLLMGELGSSMFKALPNTLRRDIATKISVDAIKDAAGKELTGQEFDNLLQQGVKKFGDKLAEGGISVLEGYKHAATNLGALTAANFALKQGVDVANDTPVFNETAGDLAEQLNSVATEQAPFFAIPSVLGAASRLNKYSHDKNVVVDELMKDASPENIDRVKNTIAQEAQMREWTPEETNKTLAHVDEIAAVTKSLPKNMAPHKVWDAVDLVQGRRDLEKELAAEQEQRKTLDPALTDIVTSKEQLLTDKIEQANDKLRDMVTNTRTTYSKGVGEEEGLFFKTVNGKKEEITPSRYELEKLERETRAESEEPVVEETPVQETIVETPNQKTKNVEKESKEVYSDEQKIADLEGWISEFDKYIERLSKDVSDPAIKAENESKLEEIKGRRELYNRNLNDIRERQSEQKPVIDEPATQSPETPADVQEQPAEPVIAQENSPAPVEAVVEKVKPDIRQKAIDAITHGIIGNGERKAKDVSPRFDLGMDTAEQKRAIRDITNGKYETAAAKKMIDKVSEFEANGDYPIIEGDGGSTVRQRGATPEEIQRNIDDIKQYKLAKEQDVELNNQQLKGQDLTHDDFENYYRHRAEELGRTGEPSDSGTVGGTPKDAQRAKNDKATSDTPNTSSEATQGKPERQPSLNEHELNRKLELRKKFAGRFNDVTNIPTLLADKEFREYAGLVLKEATGDFKAFSKELIDNIGEKIKPHLDKLFAELSEEKTRPSKNEETGERAYEMGVELKKSKERSRGEDVVEKDASDKIKNGYDVYELIDKIVKDKHAATDTEVAILNKYIDVKEGEIKTYNERLGAEGATMGKKDFMDLMDAKTKSEMEFQDAAEANRLTGRITAQALNARKFRFNKENSLENMVAKKRQALGGEKLTAEQLSEITARFSEMENIQKQLEARVKKVESDNYKLKAEQTVKKVATNRGNRPVAKAELANERAKIYDDIRSEFKKIRQSGQAMSDIPYRRELAVVAKHMPRLLRNLAQDGLIRIEDVVESLYNTFKEDLPEITKRDVTDLIAGKYDEVKPSKSELQDNIRSLRTQAKLAAHIADLEAGVKTEKSPKAIKEKNEQIEALKARLKELNKDESVDTSEKDLAALKKRLQANIDKLSKRIADGDYSKEEKKAPVKPDAEARDLQRKYDSIKHDFELQIARDYLEQRTKTQKTIDNLLNITGIPRALKSSFDFSAAGRQGLFLLPHIKESKMALKEMFGQAFSETRYNNWISDLKHDPMYDLMKESGLYIADKSDPKLSAREEEFTSNLAERIPGVKQSERAYTGYLNVVRTEVFKSEAVKLMERGYTYENSPKEFTSLARVVNILSGRGEIPKSWGHSAPKVLSLGLFSPRFLAARIQTLYLWADPSLSKNAKILAAKDVGSVLGSAISLLGMATMAGYSVNWNPTSTNFLKLEDKDDNGSTYYDILGGLPQYVRFLSQMSTGKRISAAGNETDLWAERGPTNPFESTPGDVITSFLRGKISPVPGMLINLAFRKDVVGQPYGLKHVPYDFLAPLPLASLQEAYKVGGIDNALKVLVPSTVGIGVSSYNPNEKKEDTSIKKLKLPGGSEFELNEEQVADRQKLNAKFIDEKGDKLTKAFTRKAETDKDLLKKIKKQSAEQSPEDAKATKEKLIDEYVERHIKTLANKNSMPYIYKKYKKDLKPIDE